MEGYTNISINEKIEILKQMNVWRKMSKDEKKMFRDCTDEHYADRLKRSFISKYLM